VNLNGTHRLPYTIHNYTAHRTDVEHNPPEKQYTKYTTIISPSIELDKKINKKLAP
jgi:hypothetical protein